MTQDETDILDQMVNKHGLRVVVEALADICDEKKVWQESTDILNEAADRLRG